MTESPTVRREVEILLVEDHPGDVRLVREAFEDAKLANPLHVVESGEEALDFLYRRGEYVDAPRPNFILLNLNLPTTTPGEVLTTLGGDPDLRRIPVFGLTASDVEADLLDSDDLSVDAYLSKPVDPDEFIDLARSVEDCWLTLVQVPSDGDDAAP